MSEYNLVERIERSPTWCHFCRGERGPFIDTHIQHPVEGWVYICVGDQENPGCVQQWGALAGMTSIEKSSWMEQTIVELEDARLRLERELTEKSQTVVTTIDELRQLVKR